MRSYGEHPAVVLGSTLIGLMVGVFLLLAMMGGGFLLALLVLVLTPAGAGAMGVISLFQRRRSLAQPVLAAVTPAPHPTWEALPGEQPLPPSLSWPTV